MLSLSAHDRAVLNCVFNPNLPLDAAYEAESLPALADEEDETAEVVATRRMEVEAVTRTEEGSFKDAVDILTRAISVAPNRASLYNNRAQVHRLQGHTLDALSDVTVAIELSAGKGKTGCQALCQRGLLHRQAGRTALAKDDFTAAAGLGSKFAKSQLVEMNPYAALCNQMLQQVLQREFHGQP